MATQSAQHIVQVKFTHTTSTNPSFPQQTLCYYPPAHWGHMASYCISVCSTVTHVHAKVSTDLEMLQPAPSNTTLVKPEYENDKHTHAHANISASVATSWHHGSWKGQTQTVHMSPKGNNDPLIRQWQQLPVPRVGNQDQWRRVTFQSWIFIILVITHQQLRDVTVYPSDSDSVAV